MYWPLGNKLFTKPGFLKTFSGRCQPSDTLSQVDIQKGLRLALLDGMATEAMTSFTSGSFLTAIALYLGGTALHIGILAALPVFTNVFQLLSIAWVQKSNNRRWVTVLCSLLARLPLLFISLSILFFPSYTQLYALHLFLFFHYLFGSIAGPVWNSWMKDLVEEKELGRYFAQRTKYAQSVSILLSLLLAFAVDTLRSAYPGSERLIYAAMFMVGGAWGLISVYLLARTPEPRSVLNRESIYTHIKKPLQDKNFRNLLSFHSVWLFAANLAVPFFSMFLLTTMQYPLTFVIVLGLISQLFSIFSLLFWGRVSDRFSNKTILDMATPLYFTCIFSWIITAFTSSNLFTTSFLMLVMAVNGMATAGINLALANMETKLARKDDAISYLSAKNIITAPFGAIGPVLGGILIEILSPYKLTWKLNVSDLHRVALVSLQSTHYLFLISCILGFAALRLLKKVEERGEISKGKMIRNLSAYLLARREVEPTAKTA